MAARDSPWAPRGLPFGSLLITRWLPVGGRVGSRMLSLNGSTKKQEPTLFKDTYTWHVGQDSKNLGNLGWTPTP